MSQLNSPPSDPMSSVESHDVMNVVSSSSPSVVGGSSFEDARGRLLDTMEDAQRLLSTFSNTLGGLLGKNTKKKKPKELISALLCYHSLLHPPPVEVDSPPAPSCESPSITQELDTMLTLLYGDSAEGKEPDPKIVKELVDLLLDSDVLCLLFDDLRVLEFESRKQYTRIFEFVLSQGGEHAIQYMLHRQHMFKRFIDGYDEKDVSVALSCDAILRCCINDFTLSSCILSDHAQLVLLFFKYLDIPNFDVNSHAFNTFKLLLTQHVEPAAQYLRENYDVFFQHYNQLLQSENYLAKVQSYQFLGDLLITRANQDIMLKYVNEPENLKLAMISLRGPKAIQLAVFNVLKIFVPNPYKADSITRILAANKRNFLSFLEEFEKDNVDDTVLQAHKAEMIQAFNEMPDIIRSSTIQTSTSRQRDDANSGSGNASAEQKAFTRKLSHD